MDVLESGVVSGELVAEEVVIRGTAENVVVRAKRFFATGTAKIQNCTLFLEGVSGCSIQQGAELTGDFKITTAALGAAPAAPAAPVTPAAAPASFTPPLLLPHLPSPSRLRSSPPRLLPCLPSPPPRNPPSLHRLARITVRSGGMWIRSFAPRRKRKMAMRP